MRTIIIGATLLASASAWAAPGKCLLVVDGKTYLNGPCPVDIGPGGSATIGGGGRYFSVVNPTGEGVAKGYWNEEPGARHAHSDLGDLRRNGACWTNERAVVCAWR